MTKLGYEKDVMNATSLSKIRYLFTLIVLPGSNVPKGYKSAIVIRSTAWRIHFLVLQPTILLARHESTELVMAKMDNFHATNG